MGLERLSSVFNNLEENQRDDTVSDNLFNHTFGTNYAHEDIIEITPITNAQSPSPLMAIMGTEDTIVNGHSPDSIRVNYQGSLLQTNVDISTQMEKYDLTSEVNLQNKNPVEIRSNRVNVSDITGKQLGDGNFTLESIYDPTHGGNYSERRPTYEGEAGSLLSDLLLHTAGKDVGSTANLNIRSTQGYGGRGNEPYIVQPIGSTSANAKKSGYDRDFIPYAAAGNDLVRLFNYYISADGIAFMLKENVTNFAVGDGLTLGEPFRSVMLPPLPIPMTGLLNFYQQKFQANFPSLELYKNDVDIFGKPVKDTIFKSDGLSNQSLRKPGRKNYSDMVNTLTPVTLKLQGDIPKEFIHQQKNPLEKLLGEYDGIDTRFEKDQDKRAMFSDESTGLQKGSSAAKWTGKTIGNMFLGTVDFVGKALHGAKEVAVKTTIDALGPLVSVPHLKNPTQKFLDLKPEGSVGLTIGDTTIGGGMTRYDDVVSKADISKQPLEESVANKPEAGDFYLRINDLRNGQFMYFRGYVTGITENITPSWNPVTYIGRSEDVWTYSKAERDLSFNLRLAPQNLTEFTMMYKKINKLTSLAYPKYLPEAKGALRMQGPFTELYLAHIGSRTVGQFGYIKSLTYTVNEQGDWDVISNRARVIDVAISYQILGRRPPSYNTKFYTPATVAEIDQYEYPDAYLEGGNPGEMFA